jgi:hypothetical protein
MPELQPVTRIVWPASESPSVTRKGKNESFTKSQPERFAGIEEFLNGSAIASNGPLFDSAYPQLFPPLQKGQWIHVARLVPERLGA